MTYLYRADDGEEMEWESEGGPPLCVERALPAPPFDPWLEPESCGDFLAQKVRALSVETRRFRLVGPAGLGEGVGGP